MSKSQHNIDTDSFIQTLVDLKPGDLVEFTQTDPCTSWFHVNTAEVAALGGGDLPWLWNTGKNPIAMSQCLVAVFLGCKFIINGTNVYVRVLCPEHGDLIRKSIIAYPGYRITKICSPPEKNSP